MVERGQAMTLEAVTAAILILAAIGFALQVTAVTPLSASTSSQHVENQLESTGEGILTSSAASGALEEAVLYWNTSEQKFHNAEGDRAFYTATAPPNEFGEILSEAFSDRSVAYNVYVHYQTASGSVETQQMVRQGQPSDHAISASRTIQLIDTDRLVSEDLTRNQTLDSLAADEFYVDQRSPDGAHYNLVRIEVIAWRI
jgi:hypothetical protein